MIKENLFVRLAILLLLISAVLPVSAQTRQKAVISYYSGSPERLDSFDARTMTHIIFCFGHLKGNKLHIGSARDTIVIRKMVDMKKVNPDLKVLLSLGGWGGCQTCSDVFNSQQGREDFARSVKQASDYFNSDGIDLDWEYPVVEGYPGHAFSAADKDNFTALVQQLRKTLGKTKVITFAAGGFQKYLEQAVDWQQVVPLVDYINLMTYDLVSGFSTVTGHHTPLYSSAGQKQSTDNCVQYLKSIGVPAEKLIIGAAFYARTWKDVANVNNGLYQSGVFRNSIPFRNFDDQFSTSKGYHFYWDEKTQAPYAYSPTEQVFATFDNKRSVALKAQYVLDQNLGGIMYWELGQDTFTDGMVHTINQTIKGK